MTQRRHHYELAFEDYLRARRIPYVAVDEAKKALLPGSGQFAATPCNNPAVKSFDFVLYGSGQNLLVEVKGRRLPRSKAKPRVNPSNPFLFRAPPPRSSLQNWVTLDDVQSLQTWASLFGDGFEAAFVFVYWCEEQPPDALFQEVFENRGNWYALRTVSLADYARCMKVRSPQWRTVHLPTAVFDRISRPFAPPFAGPHDPEAPALVPYEAPALARLA